MPKKNQEGFGDLYVQYRVEMPKSKALKNGSSTLSKEELHELGRLLRKLQGKSIPKKKASHDELQTFALSPALPSDFGRASGTIELEDDEHLHDDHGEEYHPFASSFFQSGTGHGSSFYFGSFGGGGHPFGGSSPYGDDDGSSQQCQQM